MAQNDIKQKTREVEKIYTDYIEEMNKLKKEQDDLLNNFLQELEKAKVEELKNKLNG